MNHEADVLRELYEEEKRSRVSVQESFYAQVKRTAVLDTEMGRLLLTLKWILTGESVEAIHAYVEKTINEHFS